MVDQLLESLTTCGRLTGIGGINDFIAQVVINESLELLVTARVELNLREFLDSSNLLLQFDVVSINSLLQLLVVIVLDDW